jgi:isoquinoline 1-oxidoreductase subunit alpha
LLRCWGVSAPEVRTTASAKGNIDMIELTVNGIKHQVDVVPDMPLLWVLRDELGITSPKYGCGIAQCGACTVQIDGAAVRSCQSHIGDVAGKSVVTIEGLADRDRHPVLQAWIEHQVPQCGYCQTGQIMQAISLLEHTAATARDGSADFLIGILVTLVRMPECQTQRFEAALRRH